MFFMQLLTPTAYFHWRNMQHLFFRTNLDFLILNKDLSGGVWLVAWLQGEGRSSGFGVVDTPEIHLLIAFSRERMCRDLSWCCVCGWQLKSCV